MRNIALKILLRVSSAASVLVIPSILGLHLAGEIFKIFAVIFFVSELTLIHFSFYIHRYFKPTFSGSEIFALDNSKLFSIFSFSVFICFLCLGILLYAKDNSLFLILTSLFLCIIYFSGRLLMVMVDEIYYIVFGETLPLILALSICILIEISSVYSFLLFKCICSLPYLIWAIKIFLKNFSNSQRCTTIRWPLDYLKRFYFPVSLTALSFPLLNWVIFSNLSTLHAVDLRFIQTLIGPINIFVSNAKASLIGGKVDGNATKLGLFLSSIYIICTVPFLFLILYYGNISLFNIEISASIFIGIYMLALPSFIILKNIELIILSSYSPYRNIMGFYQVLASFILSFIFLLFDTNSFFASAIFAFHTLLTIFIILKVSK